MRLSIILCACAYALTMTAPILAQSDSNTDTKTSIESFFSDVEISGTLFIAAEAKDNEDGTSSQFFINRGYINVKKKLSKTLSMRITPDIAVDRDGDGEGDLELRLKYCYIKAKLPEVAIFTSPNIEFGLSSRPLLNFEQSVNRYRVEGQMFLERNDVINTADFGGSFNTYFGGKMDEEYRKEVNSKYAGKYGSLSIGVYNGGGYHAIERNENKTIEGRLSIRPLPTILPGLQLTYGGALGKGNTVESPDFSFNTGYLTWECKRLRIVGQFFTGEGNYKGKPVDDLGFPEEYEGYAAFADINIPTTPINIFGQYSEFKRTVPSEHINRRNIIAGIAYYFGKNKVLVDFDRTSFPDAEEEIKDDVRYKFSVEINY